MAPGPSTSEVTAANRRVFAEMEKYFKAVPEHAEKGMLIAGKRIIETAKEFAPLDTGALRDSGRVFKGQRGKDGVVSVWLSFGGNVTVTPTENAPTGIVNYAVLVHEDLERTYRIGGPKYLENALKFHANELTKIIADSMRSSALKGRKR